MTWLWRQATCRFGRIDRTPGGFCGFELQVQALEVLEKGSNEPVCRKARRDQTSCAKYVLPRQNFCLDIRKTCFRELSPFKPATLNLSK